MEHIFSYQGKKGDILKASAELFAAKGYDGVSVRDIAKRAGVTEAALYKHYKGKEEMSLHLFKDIMGEYCKRIKSIHEKEITSVDKLCQIVYVTYDLYEEHTAAIRYALLSQHNFWIKVTDDLRPHLLFRKIIEEGIQKGEISGTDEEVYLLISVYTGLLLEPLAQYTYFYDALPPMNLLKEKIASKVRKVLA